MQIAILVVILISHYGPQDSVDHYSIVKTPFVNMETCNQVKSMVDTYDPDVWQSTCVEGVSVHNSYQY